MRRVALVLVALCALSVAAQHPQHTQPRWLPQNWTDEDRQWFYTTPQGSKLILYTWAMALERADSQEFWAVNLDRFYFLPNAPNSVNPDGLPVGVVRDGQHMGLTCAACHTGAVAVNGQMYQIDGGPTSADLYEFLADLARSLAATSRSASDPKFIRFANRVLGAGDNPTSRAQLYRQLSAFNSYFQRFIRDSTPTVAKWGRARTDAFGMIFNRVTAIDLNVPSNTRSPNAPVSYPFLWDTSWHNKVQWNGIAPNSLVVERLARNVGEVLGVFAQIDIEKPKFLHWYYESTANRANLIAIEDRLSQLRAPKWQAEWGALDEARVARGRAIYDRQCIQCHAIATPGKPQNIVLTPLQKIGTDPVMTTVSAQRTAKTGILQGVPKYLIFGTKLGATETASTITGNAVIGAILSPFTSSGSFMPSGMAATNTTPVIPLTNNDPDDDDRARLLARITEGPSENEHTAARTHAAAAAGATTATTTTSASPGRLELLTELRGFAARHDQQDDLGLVYKARPLDGIWATAPYLHNGSVPTIYDLLLPVERRPKTFWVGSRELDTRRVGYQYETQTNGAFRFDTSIRGNLNTGHLYGTTLEEEARLDLIEYLKSL